jgi:hypothetical protein
MCYIWMWFHHINLHSFLNFTFQTHSHFIFSIGTIGFCFFHFGTIGFSQKDELLTHVSCWHMYTNSSSSPHWFNPYYFLRDLPIFVVQWNIFFIKLDFVIGENHCFAMWFICRLKFTHIVNAAQFSHFCIEDFQKKKKPPKKKGKNHIWGFWGNLAP